MSPKIDDDGKRLSPSIQGVIALTAATLLIQTPSPSHASDFANDVLNQAKKNVAILSAEEYQKYLPAALVFKQADNKDIFLAGHQSHSSHRSHASHASHYSSSGGGYSTPTPQSVEPQEVTPSESTTPSSSDSETSKKLIQVKKDVRYVVNMKEGEIYKGTIVDTGAQYMIKTKGGVIVVNKTDVESIKKAK